MSKQTSPLDPKLLSELLKNCKTAEDILGSDGIIKQITKALLEGALKGEMSEHLGYEKHDPEGNGSGNSRNGKTSKTVQTRDGAVVLDIPRDRNGEFSPQIIKKNQKRFEGFDEKIIALYARGMSTRDIQAQLEEIYDVDVSATLISQVTNEVISEVKTWQSRSLDPIYPIVYLDALVIKVQQDNHVINKAFYLALGVNLEGEKELLGIWVSQNEGAKFWLGILTELNERGVKDIFIACIDGLSGFSEAIRSVYPQTQIQRCIVHMVRDSLKFVGWQKRKVIAADLKKIYGAKILEEAEVALENFAEKWDKEFPAISKSWRSNWLEITPMFEYPAEIRKVIYTTNAIESVNMSLRKVIKNKRVFPSDDAALKLLYLALRNISKRWKRPIRDWKSALNRFAIMFEERLTSFLQGFL